MVKEYSRALRPIQFMYRTRLLPTVLLFIAGFAIAAATPPAEKLLPDDTLVFATAPDFPKLRETLKKSPTLQLWNDPAMKPVREKFMARFRDELVTPLERDLGVKLDDYANFVQGQITFAVTANGWQGAGEGKPGIVLLVDTGDKKAQLAKSLTEFRKKWIDGGRSARVEKVREFEFVALTLSSNDLPATLRRMLPGAANVRELGDGKDDEKPKPGKVEFIIGQAGSLFIAGNELKPIERIVGQLSAGTSPVVADLAQFQSCQPEYFRNAQAFGWVNAKAFVEILTKVSARREEIVQEAPDPMATIRPEKILSAAGLGGLRNVALAFQDAPEGPLIQLHLGLPEAERSGILKVVTGETKDCSPPPFVPADALAYSRWRLDGQKSWHAFTNALADMFPTFMNVLADTVSAADEAGKFRDDKFDFRRQFIENLGDDVIYYQKKPRAGEEARPPFVTLVAAKNTDEMMAVLKLIFAPVSGDKGSEEREFLGRKIYTVTTMSGPQLDPTTPPRASKIVLSASGGYVLLSTDEAAVEEYLRSAETPVKALRETAGLLEASAKVSGPGMLVLGFQNQLELARLRFDAAKRFVAATNDTASGLTPVSESFGFDLPEDSMANWIDYSLLPPFDAIAKYYSFMVYGVSGNVDGLTLKVFLPAPAGMKK